MKPLHELTIAEIQLLLQQKQFSSREITGHFLDRIAQQNSIYNCYISVDNDGALQRCRCC